MTSRILVVYEGGKYKGRASSAETIDFLSIKIGASALEISETTGAFNFNGINIGNVGTVDGRDVAEDGTALDGVIDDVGNLVTLSGVAVDSLNLGTFTGSILDDNTETNKTAFQKLVTAVELGSDDQTASEVPYTAAVVADWDGDGQPGSTKQALDQLAERVDDNELAIIAGDDQIAAEVPYTAAQVTDWDGDSQPGNTKQALDQLAERIDDEEIFSAALTHDGFADFVANEHLPGIDEDTMVSDSDSAVPTQQSVKAFVTTQIAAAVTGSASWKEVLLHDDQLKDGSATSDGILPAGAIYFANQPIAGDNIVTSHDGGSSDLTFAFVANIAAESGDADVSIESNAVTAMQRLVLRMNAHPSRLTEAVFVADNLDEINSSGIIVLLLKDGTAIPSTANQNGVFGTWGTQADVQRVNFADAKYESSISGNLPTSFEANFGLGRQSVSVLSNEAHAVRDNDKLAIWNGDLDEWTRIASPGAFTSSGFIDITGDNITLKNLSDGTLILGDGSNLAQEVTMSGDVTISNAGVSAIGNDKVVKEMINADVAGNGLRQNVDGSLERDDTETFTNDNASPITVRQIVFIKSSNGNVDLADASAFSTSGSKLGIVEDASIAAAAGGLIVLRPGAKISGFSGLTPGAAQFLSLVSGAITETPPSASGEVVVQIGQALGQTLLEWDPQIPLEIA